MRIYFESSGIVWPRHVATILGWETLNEKSSRVKSLEMVGYSRFSIFYHLSLGSAKYDIGG